jgi:CheY-like chemotaxis protein
MPHVQSPPTVVVVDDTASIRELLLHSLQGLLPYPVVAVADATTALATLAARPVPLMITDYHLSDMRGDALATAIKAISPATKVLMITADVALDGQQAWVDVDRCLIKPFPLRELIATVGALLAEDTPG